MIDIIQSIGLIILAAAIIFNTRTLRIHTRSIKRLYSDSFRARFSGASEKDL